MEKLISGVISVAAFLSFGFIGYTMFILCPVSIYAQSECLRNGYPNAYVTIGLERYCSTLDGSVTVKVVRQ